MADFDIALGWILNNEDGPPPYRYKTVMDSNGGHVISGINELSYPTQFATINALPQSSRGPAVSEFYRLNFWAGWGDQLVSNEAAKRILDAMVNMGIVPAVRIAQSAAGATIDGHMGPLTISAINSAEEGFIGAFQQARLARYRAIVAAHPEDAAYLGTEENPGPWWRRAIA